MKARFLVLICISVTLSLVGTRAAACPSCEPPVAGFSVNPASYTEGIHIIAIDTDVYFSAGLLSYDPDHCGPSHYYWDLWDPSYASTPADDEFRAARYDTVGDRYVRLSVSDNDYPCCCYGEPGCADKMSGTATATIRVVKVDKLQYFDLDAWAYKDVTDTLYVVFGEDIQFKAVPNPARTPLWPPDKPAWGGSSGASGVGVTKTVTFGSLSSHPTDYKTVTVNCGNTITANVIVFDFRGITTPQDNFTGGSGVRYGIKEVVDLSAEIVPTGLTADDVGGLEWRLVIGTGDLDDVDTAAGTAVYTAPPQPDTVMLELQSLSPACAQKCSQDERTIVEPDGGRCWKRTGSNIWHQENTYSIGLQTYMYLQPTDVSFHWIKIQEGLCRAQVQGWFELTASDYWHSAWEHWAGVSLGNAATGCQIIIEGGRDYDTFELSYPNPPPYYYGTFRWPIPWWYKADSYTYEFATVNADSRVHGGSQYGKADIKKDNSGWFYNYHHWPSQPY